MNTRRAFIKVALGSAVPVSLATLHLRDAFGFTTESAPRLATVIVDVQHAPSRIYGRSLGAMGANVLSIENGDFTSLWRNDLPGVMSAMPATITGLTTPAALFCFEQLAWNHGLRVVFHSEHAHLQEGAVQHHILRSGDPGDLAARLTAADEAWPQRLAAALVNYRALHGPRPGPSLAALQPTLPKGATLLTSWVIA